MNAYPLQLRDFEPADHSSVMSLHELGLRSVGVHAGDGPWDDDLRDIDSVYTRNRGAFLVGELDGRLVAMGALRRTDEERAEVKRMRVHPDVQRRGYGRLILGEIEGRARALGYQVLHLDTSERQVPAQRLYESAGYSRTDETLWQGMLVYLYEKRL